MNKKIYTIAFAILVISALSMIFIDKYFHRYSYIDEWGNEIILDYDDIIGCTSSVYFDEETESWQQSKCNEIPIKVLEDFVMDECVSYWANALGVYGWDECEVNFELDHDYKRGYVWIYDHNTCKQEIEKCNKSNYCEIALHGWSNGESSLIYHYNPINKSKIVEDEVFYYKMLGLKTWQDVNDYNNGRGMWYHQILNCHN